MVQDCFIGNPTPQAFSYEILCIIPKLERGKYHGIALLEVLYKLVSMIIHVCIQDCIKFHPSIHGFHTGHGTGTCTIEAKMHMQLASYLGHPLYQIYLDLTKAYDTLDHTCTLSLLKAYCIGPHTCSLIEEI